MTPTILSETRTRLGLSSWQALADLLGVPARRVRRWLKNGIPPGDVQLVHLACERLVELHGRRAA